MKEFVELTDGVEATTALTEDAMTEEYEAKDVIVWEGVAEADSAD